MREAPHPPPSFLPEKGTSSPARRCRYDVAGSPGGGGCGLLLPLLCCEGGVAVPRWWARPAFLCGRTGVADGGGMRSFSASICCASSNDWIAVTPPQARRRPSAKRTPSRRQRVPRHGAIPVARPSLPDESAPRGIFPVSERPLSSTTDSDSSLQRKANTADQNPARAR